MYELNIDCVERMGARMKIAVCSRNACIKAFFVLQYIVD